MRKLILATVFVVALSGAAAAQAGGSQSSSDIPNMGRAPLQENGVGKLDARVSDESGNPVKGVYLKLESSRSDGFFCESWNTTDERGVAVLPPLHMGRLRLIVKAKGYYDQKLDVDASTLGEPYRVTLKKK
ncbi:MAG: carboxypeptidase-like regulatory domain-containing protein [Acidobacteria bacterium]|nr:carboxypeptidase-like regulatory domain-containing protein [Acidobacteriota bacterium]MCA1643201.1 carboxypeptidase-like regulatory domain-containing protein [Acidobacteriota bacterium]